MKFFKYFFTLKIEASVPDPYPDPHPFSKPWIQNRIRKKWMRIRNPGRRLLEKILLTCPTNLNMKI